MIDEKAIPLKKDYALIMEALSEINDFNISTIPFFYLQVTSTRRFCLQIFISFSAILFSIIHENRFFG